jgi:hypothetical protein
VRDRGRALEKRASAAYRVRGIWISSAVRSQKIKPSVWRIGHTEGGIKRGGALREATRSGLIGFGAQSRPQTRPVRMGGGRSCGYKFSCEEFHHHSRRDPDEMIRLLLPKIDTDRLATRLKETQERCYRDRFLPAVKPFRGVRALFAQIKRAGGMTALATTCSKDEPLLEGCRNLRSR